MIERIVKDFPNIKLIAASLRSANQNSWGGICWSEGDVFEVPQRDIPILDRVGGGDSFATGLIHGLLSGESVECALQCGVAHRALAMSTPGDTTMTSVSEVLKAMNGGSARIER
jgi:2-dehydro-3-deoxygluconokinase